MLAGRGRGRPDNAWLGSALGITWITKLGMQRINCHTHCNAKVNCFAGGSHGVRFRPASQSVSCRHKIRDRRQARWGRSGAGVQPVFGIPRWHIFSAAGSADAAKSQAGETGYPTSAPTRRPLSRVRPLAEYGRWSTGRARREAGSGDSIG